MLIRRQCCKVLVFKKRRFISKLTSLEISVLPIGAGFELVFELWLTLLVMFTSQFGLAHVLLVDDDVELLSMMAELLRNQGMEVRCASSWRVAQGMLERAASDVLVLDVMLPDANGLDVCRHLRGQGCVKPILMLTARGEPMDRVLGLELGADDYLAKPFEPRELVARIRALYRRGRDTAPAHTLLRFGELEVDLVGFRVVYAHALVSLSSSEFKLLATLARQPGKPMSREDLSAAVQPGSYMPLDRAVKLALGMIG
jgi:DNA-binding response OmpR family regulator